jgi:hypothetical protein
MWGLSDTPADVVDAAAEAGASEFDPQAPWMEARIADLDDPELPPGVTIEEVRYEAGHRLWAATLREIYAFPALGERAWLMPGELRAWNGSRGGSGIAFVDGERVAGFFTTPEGEPLYRSLGFESRGWVSRWLGGFGDPVALARARGAIGH